MSQWSWTWRWRSILDSERLAVGLTRNICIEYYRETVATHSKTVKKIGLSLFGVGGAGYMVTVARSSLPQVR